jgi:hypothetical protein
MKEGTFWWRLVHLEPTILRGALVGILGLAGAFGILGLDFLPDTILGFWVPLMALIQVLITRPAVTANARVVVEAPNPISQPGIVVAGEATTEATSREILEAAKDVPRG